jgi:glycosyltransferase involved in cell wall biosynthesis
MHILQMAPYYPPYPGGQERYVRSLSRMLVQSGHRVTVITSDYPPGCPRVSVEDGIQVFRFRTVLRLFRNPITPGMIFPPRQIRDFDLIHAHNEHGFSSNAAVLLKRLSRKPLVLTSHGNLVYGSRIPDAACSVYEATFGRIVFGQADRITVATPSEKERIVAESGVPREKIEVIPVGIDTVYWNSFAETAKLPAAMEKINPDTKVILVATQLIRRKGIDHLIRAIPAVGKQLENFVVVLAGSGDAEKELKSLTGSLHLERRVIFLGRLFENELTAVYRRADIFVLPSIGEGQPTCILEAWLQAKPVVATDISGVSDYYRDAAILVPVADSPALAEAILRILQHPHIGMELGRKGRRLVESAFEWRVLVKSMVSLYESAMQSRE